MIQKKINTLEQILKFYDDEKGILKYLKKINLEYLQTILTSNRKKYFCKKYFLLYVITENDKCLWSIQSSKMLHDNKKKTIYYDNAVIKVYDIPIMFIPRLSCQIQQ